MSHMDQVLKQKINSDEQNRDLLRRARDGDRDAWDQVVMSFSPLVWSLAMSMRVDKTIDPEVLYQEGMIGVIQALETFDLKQDKSKVSSHVALRARYSIMGAFPHERLIYVPRRQSKDHDKPEYSLQSEVGDEFSFDEIHEVGVNMSPSRNLEMREILETVAKHRSDLIAGEYTLFWEATFKDISEALGIPEENFYDYYDDDSDHGEGSD